jgi:hypothetical protein
VKVSKSAPVSLVHCICWCLRLKNVHRHLKHRRSTLLLDLIAPPYAESDPRQTPRRDKQKADSFRKKIPTNCSSAGLKIPKVPKLIRNHNSEQSSIPRDQNGTGLCGRPVLRSKFATSFESTRLQHLCQAQRYILLLESCLECFMELVDQSDRHCSPFDDFITRGVKLRQRLTRILLPPFQGLGFQLQDWNIDEDASVAILRKTRQKLIVDPCQAK